MQLSLLTKGTSLAGQTLKGHEPDVMPRSVVLLAWIPQSNDQLE